MRLPRTFIALAAICLLALPGVAQARGGLTVDPGIFEAAARPGGLGAVKVSNTTERAMRVHLAVRPWLQAHNGSVAPNRRKVLGKVRASRRSFGLAPGATRAIGLSLTARPKRSSLYGAIEVTGTPKRRGGGKGVKVAYRLITSLRLFPPGRARRYRARPARLYVKGTARRGALFLAVKNTGNTIEPIGATVRLRGRDWVFRSQAAPQTILPGASVNLRLARLRGTLPRGRYRLFVRLMQSGHKVGALRRGVRLR